MLELILSIVFAVHLLCANVASAGPLYCILLERFAARSHDSWVSNVGRRLSLHSMSTLLLASLVGLLIGVLLWVRGDESFFRALSLFWPRIWWGCWEIVFSFVCYGLYWALWPRTVVGRSMGLTMLHRLLALLGTTNLLYHFPSLFGAIAYAARHPGAFESTLTSAQFRRLVYSGQIVSLNVHFWLASIAVAGVFLMWLGQGAAKDSNATALMSITRWCARAALCVSVLQMPVGVWILIQVDPLQQQSLLGGDILSTCLLVLSVVFTFALLHQLAAMSLGESSVKDLQKAAAILLLIVTFMTAALRQSRMAYEGESDDHVATSGTLEMAEGHTEHRLGQGRNLQPDLLLGVRR